MIALVLVACVTGPGSRQALPSPDPDVFAAQVQPVLAASCANPSCHGRADRPLSVFAEGRYRMDPDATFLDEPLTEDELAHNFTRAAAFLVDVERAIDCELVGKPLAVEAGGMEHEGGALYADLYEPDLLAIKDWVAAALVEAP